MISTEACDTVISKDGFPNSDENCSVQARPSAEGTFIPDVTSTGCFPSSPAPPAAVWVSDFLSERIDIVQSLSLKQYIFVRPPVVELAAEISGTDFNDVRHGIGIPVDFGNEWIYGASLADERN